LLASDGAESDHFGKSVAISGNTTVIGSWLDDDNGVDSGSAYIFDVTTGQQLFKMLPSDGEADDRFGYSVAIDGDFAVIGAIQDDSNGPDSGSAYIFDVTTGQQLFKLLPDDGDADDNFGFSVAISGHTAVIGAWLDDDNGSFSGSAYVFDVNTGQQLFKLLPDDGMADDLFGYSIAISGNIAVIGANQDSDNGYQSGSAYVFDVTTGQQLFKLLPDDGAGLDEFGYSVAIDNNLAVIGAIADDGNAPDSGSAYVFDVNTGQQLFKLLADNGAKDDNFGISVAVNDNLSVIGAMSDGDNGFDSGSVYVFDVTTGRQLYTIYASDGDTFDQFGISVAIRGNLTVIGAARSSKNGKFNYFGSAYVFQQQPTCLDLTVDNLIAGEQAVFTITGGIPGTRAVTLYGTKFGKTKVGNFSGYCATFGFNTTQNKMIGGANHVFDANGEVAFHELVTKGASGTKVFFQSAMQGTCPEECMSNLVEMTVQ